MAVETTNYFVSIISESKVVNTEESYEIPSGRGKKFLMHHAVSIKCMVDVVYKV